MGTMSEMAALLSDEPDDKVAPGGLSSLMTDPLPDPEFRIPLLSNLADIPRLYQEEKAGAVKDIESDGVFTKIAGVLRGTFSPVTAISKAFVGGPVKRATGSETAGEVARIGAELLTPGIGLTKVPAALRELAGIRSVGELARLPKPSIMPIAPELKAEAPLVEPMPLPEVIQDVPRVTTEPPIKVSETEILPKEGSPIPGEPVSPTKPLPVNPESLALPGEIGLAYHAALNPQVFKRAGAAGIEYFKNNPEKYNRTLSVTENIGNQIGKEGGIDSKWLKDFGLGDDEFKTVSEAYESMRQSAQSMSHMSRVSKELNLRLKGLPAEQRDALGLAAEDIDDAAEMLPWWRRVDNIGRGAMVSQLGTAVRNAETVVARLGMDTMTSALDNGIARVIGKEPKVGALDGFETFMNTIGAIRPKNYRGQKNLVSEMMTAFPSATGRLLTRYNSDLRVGGAAGDAAGMGEKALRGGEKLVDMANVFNRGQEFLIRRAVFQSSLAQEVRKGGTELDDIVKSGEGWKVPEEAVNKAVDRALEVTFAQAAKPGTASADFVNMINKTAPLSTLGIPFPRFLTQSWKFTFEHSPLGVLRYLSKDERAKVAGGDMSGISKAVIGTGLFGAAAAMRHSPNAGARWWEYKKDNGKIVDLRPFAPFSTYLFMADLMDHATGRRQGQMDSKDVINGLLGVNIRAGTGLSLLDSALEGAVNSAKQGDIPAFLKQLSGEYAARATVPFAQLRDAYDELVDGVSVTRERAPEGREFTGPIIGNLPILSRSLPEVQSATQAGPPLTEKPFTLKQLTGIRQTPGKSPGAEELDRLGFRMNEILPKTGEKTVDRKYAEKLGPLVEGPLSSLVLSPRYQAMTDEQKGVVIADQLQALRGVMRLQAGLTPQEAVRLRVGDLPERTKLLLNKGGALSQALGK